MGGIEQARWPLRRGPIGRRRPQWPCVLCEREWPDIRGAGNHPQITHRSSPDLRLLPRSNRIRGGWVRCFFFGSISDHRPVLLGLHLHNGQPFMSPGRQSLGSPRRALDLDLTHQDQVTAYRSYTEGLLQDLPPFSTQEEAASLLQTLCLTSAALVQKQSRHKASTSMGRRHGSQSTTGGLHHHPRSFTWLPGPPAMALPGSYNADLPAIIDRRERTARGLT